MYCITEEDIELRCKKLSTSTVSFDNYILLMDCLLEQPDSSIEKLDNCSVYIDGNSNICTGSPENSIILKSHSTYVTPELPGEVTGLTATTGLQGCDTGTFDPHGFRNNASDTVVSCEPSSPTARARVKDNVDHMPKAKHGSGAFGFATPDTPQTIDI